MLNGYFLRGGDGEDEYLFVLRTTDPEDICRLIMRLCKTRDKDLRELGEQLEKDWNDRHSNDQRQARKDSSGPRPKNSSKVSKRKQGNN